MKDNITPTRHNLMRITERLRVAQRGHDTLERKRDRLILELIDLINRERELHNRLEQAWTAAERARDRALLTEGGIALRSAAEACAVPPEVLFSSTSLMGVTLPQIESRNVKKSVQERGYGFMGTSAAVDETARTHEEVLELVVVIAEIEADLRSLTQSIQQTMAQVRALEHRLIPNLEETRDYIQFQLDEREREERLRQFHFKRLRERNDHRHNGRGL